MSASASVRAARTVAMRSAIGIAAVAGAFAGVPAAAIADPAPGTAAIVEWNRTAMQTTVASNGVREHHDVALVHAAVFDAVNSIRPRYAPYRVRLAAPGGASVEAAVATAAHLALVARYPTQRAELDTALAAALAKVPDGRAETDGAAVGRAAAAALLELRAQDGSGDTVSHTPGTGPGTWVPTPPQFGPPLEPGWGRVVPYLLRFGAQFRPPAPPALDGGRYARDFRETASVGEAQSATRTPAQTDVARFWNVSGAKLFNQAAQQLVLAHDLGPTAAARVFALLNLTGADALIATWDAKFTYNRWRPVTAIRAADTDGNPATDPEPDWTPLLVTPPHQEYVSASSAVAGASEVVLGSVFGARPGTFELRSPGLPGAVRTYDAVAAVADEGVDARVWAGIHWRTSDRAGRALGRRVARFALRRALRAG
jgi:PAP2 superfamily